MLGGSRNKWKTPSSDDKTAINAASLLHVDDGVYGHNKQLKIWKKIRLCAGLSLLLKGNYATIFFYSQSLCYPRNWIITPEITLQAPINGTIILLLVFLRRIPLGRKTCNAHLWGGHFHSQRAVKLYAVGLNRSYCREGFYVCKMRQWRQMIPMILDENAAYEEWLWNSILQSAHTRLATVQLNAVFLSVSPELGISVWLVRSFKFKWNQVPIWLGVISILIIEFILWRGHWMVTQG